MTKSFSCIVAFAVSSLAGFAAPQSYDFKDPKGVNNVVFKLDAPLESINGTANGISGSVQFDPQSPKDLKGKIVVAGSTLHVGNPTMKEHLHSDKWMDVKQFPEITFETTGIDKVVSAENSTVAQVTGNLTIKGKTKSITAPLKITYLPGKLKARFPMMEGDLLVLRSNFKIKRSDFGINSGAFEDKVSDEIDLSFSLAGMSPKK
ncbi:MAG: YceI family protein [Verrucomicrobiales bacterium]|nr:YceI family protein [Verrucomicrobiales bacterium]